MYDCINYCGEEERKIIYKITQGQQSINLVKYAKDML